MTILRPITEISPASRETLEATGLPFGFVLQPFASIPTKTSTVIHHDNIHTTTTNNDDRNNNSITQPCKSILPLNEYLIAKCTYCGSPINPTSEFISTWTVLCHLCGQVFPIDYDSQSSLRMTRNNNSNNNDYRKYKKREKEYKARYSTSSRVSRNDEMRYKTIEYALPLFSIPSSTLNNNNNSNNNHESNEIYSLPADMCPPLLTILIDGTSTDPLYYSTICSCIQSLLYYHSGNHHNQHNTNKTNHQSTKHGKNQGCKIGIFIMTQNGGLSIFDLNNSYGHIKHLSVIQQQKEQDGTQLLLQSRSLSLPSVPLMEVIKDINDIYVSIDSDYSKSCIESALRVIQDSHILNQACQRNAEQHTSNMGGVYLGQTIQYILDYLDQVAYHPGMYHNIYNEHYNRNNNSSRHSADMDVHDKFLYAGGKIMCFLAGSPMEISGNNSYYGKIGTGGFGGSCAEIGKRFDNADHHQNRFSNDDARQTNDTDKNEDDIELGNNNPSSNMIRRTKDYENKDDKIRSNEDIPMPALPNVETYYNNLGTQCAHFALSVEIFSLTYETSHNQPGTFIGIPYIRLLSDRSGGNGPLIIPLLQQKKHGDDHRLDSLNDNESTNSDLLLREFLSRSTITRPTAFGSFLRIRLSPSMKIKTDSGEDNSINGISKVKDVTKNNLVEYYCTNGVHGPVSATIEHELFLMGSCDNFSSISFEIEHKNETIGDYVFVDNRDKQLCPCIQIAFAYTSVVKINNKWSTVRRVRVTTQKLDVSNDIETVTLSLDTEALIVNRFHRMYEVSLQQNREFIRIFATNWLLNVLLACYKSAHMIQDTGRTKKNFCAADRLINISHGSQLTKKDKLLAKGHEQLQLTPLMVFCLIQCDALRPKFGTFDPSLDAQCAAAANMYNMSPSVMSRCIAPRLELWMSGLETKRASHDSLSMNIGEIIFFIKGMYLNEVPEEKPLLFLDTPRQIMICDAQNICDLQRDTNGDLVSKTLDNTIQIATVSYRVPPPFKMYNTKCEEARRHLSDSLIEDSLLSNQKSYDTWLSQIAAELERHILNL